MFKIIQKREAKRLAEMLASDDREMKQLAFTILDKRELIRFSLGSIVMFHAFLFLITATTISAWAWDKYPNLHISMTLFTVMQFAWSVYHCINVASFRDKYNETVKKYTPF